MYSCTDNARFKDSGFMIRLPAHRPEEQRSRKGTCFTVHLRQCQQVISFKENLDSIIHLKNPVHIFILGNLCVCAVIPYIGCTLPLGSIFNVHTVSVSEIDNTQTLAGYFVTVSDQSILLVHPNALQLMGICIGHSAVCDVSSKKTPLNSAPDKIGVSGTISILLLSLDVKGT